MAFKKPAGVGLVFQVMEQFSNGEGDSVSSITIICSSASFAEAGKTRDCRCIPVSLTPKETLNSAVRKSCLHG